MKVLLLPADKSGCGYYRMTEPMRTLQEAGADIEFEVDNGLDVDGERRVGEETVLRSVDAHGADVVVFQRPSNHMMLQATRMLQAEGVAVIAEIDDLFHGVSNAHAGYQSIVTDKAADRMLDCAREADLVTVTTPALAQQYARHGRVRIIPNAIPRRIAELEPAYERNSDTAPVTVGWTGSVYTHPHDLQMVGTGLRTALDRVQGQARFAILGQAHGARERLALADEPTEIPWIPNVDEYLTQIGQVFDIGLAPLRIDKFNIAKSYLKPLEYAARGVCSIRSVIVEYDRLGFGWKAKNPKDWAQAITRLTQSPEFRREAAAREHEKVLTGHLTEHTAERWLNAWQQAANHRSKISHLV